jgi:hypothetical protein
MSLLTIFLLAISMSLANTPMGGKHRSATTSQFLWAATFGRVLAMISA